MPCLLIIYGTSTGPQNDIGNCSGPCSSLCRYLLGFHLSLQDGRLSCHPVTVIMPVYDGWKAHYRWNYAEQEGFGRGAA